MSETAITPKQLDNLKHMIGLDDNPRFERPARKRIYKAYRNYWAAGYKPNPYIEKLCEMRLCVRQDSSSGYIYYYVTEAGAEIIRQYTGVTVRLGEQN